MFGPALIAGWAAVRHRRWTVHALQQRCGARLFTVTVNGIDEVMTFDAFLEAVVSASLPSVSIFDPSFDFDAPELLNDYSVPAPFGDKCDLLAALPSELRPDFRWFLVGPAGSGSKLHVDVLQTTAWNALIVGEKQWVIAEPNSSLAGETSDAQSWFADTLPELVARSSKESGAAADPRLFTFTQRAGETVVVPRGWYHAVLNTAPWAVAVTHNFVCPSEPDLDAFIGAYAAAASAGASPLTPAQLAACDQLMRRRLVDLHSTCC